MDATIQQLLDRLITAYHDGRRLALLFDYDGTLVPIVSEPNLAVLPAGVRELLEQLARLPRVAVGFLSGRRLTDLKAIVGIPDAYYAGTGGLEVDLQGTVHTPPKAAAGRKLAESILRPLQDIAARFPGAWVENKGLAVAVHYRAVKLRLVLDLLEEATRLLRPLRGQVRVLPGPRAMEILPDLGWNKGTALRKIVEHVGPNTLPFFAGDAANDADALAAASALGGIALWIGANPPLKIPFHLPGPAALADFLALLPQQLAAPW